MKRFFVLFAIASYAVVLSATPAAAQGKKKAIADFLRSISPTWDSPMLKNTAGINVGGTLIPPKIQVEHYNMVFRNSVQAPLRAEIIAYEKVLATLGPGGVAVDDRLTQWHNEIVPGLMKFSDQGGKFFGFCWGKMQLSPGWQISQPLTCRLENILRPDGAYGYTNYSYGTAPTYPIPVADLREETVHLPRKWWSGTNGLQVANDSYFTVRLQVNGHTVAMIPAEGGVNHFEEKVISGWGIVRSVHVDYLQQVGGQNLLINSSYDIPYGLFSSGIVGRQLIIGPPSFGAQLY